MSGQAGLESPRPLREPEERWPSRQMRFVIRILSTEPRLMADPEAFRAAHMGRTYPTPPSIPGALHLAADVSERSVEGFAVFTLTPKVAASPPERSRSEWHIMYLHGGGYCDEILSIHWDIILNLITHTGATVTVPLYPLAPEHTHHVGHRFVEGIYREIIEQTPADRVVLMGDSAGGGLCLAQTMRYRDQGMPLPNRLILFAPWVDVRLNNPDIADIEPHDPVLALPGATMAGRWWAAGDSLADPQISPLFGDLRGLPPIDMYTGTLDILNPDIQLMAAKLNDAGVAVRSVEFRGAIHVYVGATFTPEARDTYRQIAITLGTEDLRPAIPARLVTAPAALLARQLAVRLQERGTPWIRHPGLWSRIRGEYQQDSAEPVAAEDMPEPHEGSDRNGQP